MTICCLSWIKTTATSRYCAGVVFIDSCNKALDVDFTSPVMSLLVKRLSKTATLPTRGSKESAGLDLYADENGVIKPGERKLISTGIGVAIKPGCYGRVAPRSSLALKHGIQVLAGVIDSDYRNEIKVILINLGDAAVSFIRGDRISQLIIEKIEMLEPVEVEELDETKRGAGGFGSTGR